MAGDWYLSEGDRLWHRAVEVEEQADRREMRTSCGHRSRTERGPVNFVWVTPADRCPGCTLRTLDG